MARKSLPMWLRVAFVLALAVGFGTLQRHLFTDSSGLALATAAPLTLGPIRSFSKTFGQLRELVTPTAGQPESIPWVMYDTQQYAQAGSTTLNFFNSTTSSASDQTLTNFFTGQTQAKQFFEIHRIFATIHAMPNTNATTAITGAANDVEILHKTARGVVSWNFNGKPYGPVPLSYFGRPGGPLPIYAGYGSGTAANNVISAGETEANGGFPILGNIIITPSTQFTLTMTFNNTAISAATNITVSMLGILHRPVA